MYKKRRRKQGEQQQVVDVFHRKKFDFDPANIVFGIKPGNYPAAPKYLEAAV